MNLSRTARADLWLVLVTVLAAVSWIFSKEAVLLMPPVLFISIRFLLAGLLLFIVGFQQIRTLNWHQYKQAILVGSVFAFGMCFWILGLHSGVSLSVGGFITSLAVLFTPLLAKLFFAEPLPQNIWFALPVAVLGLLLLSLKGGIVIETGLLLFMIASLCFAFFFILNTRAANHREIGGLEEIMDISQKVPVLSLTAITLLTVGGLAGLLSLLMETWVTAGEYIPLELVGWVLMSAFIGTAARFFIQTHAQSLSADSHGVVIMMVEPIWTALLAAAWFSEVLSRQDLIGCLLIFLSLIIVRWESIRHLFSDFIKSGVS